MMTQNGSQNTRLNFNSDSRELNQDKIQILIVDDSEAIREGFKVMLQQEADLKITGLARNGREAIELIKARKPDVVLMDLEMPELNGISSTQIISEQFSTTKVLIISDQVQNSYISQSLEAGAKGYFLKQTPTAEVAQGIRNVYQGFCQFSPGLLENYITHTAHLTAQTDDSLLPESELNYDLVNSSPDPIAVPLEPVSPKGKPWLRWIAIGATLVITALAITTWAIAKLQPDFYNRIVGNPQAPTPVTPPVPTPTAISALGKIEPEGEIIQLSVSAAAEGSRVDQLLVERGERVKQGQVVAVLDSYDRAAAALDRAKTNVSIAQANLERVQAGAKQGDIDAQKSAINRLEAELRGQTASQEADISRLKAELDNAQGEYDRYQQLFNEGAISAQERDTRRLRVDTVRQQLEQASENLNRTIETTQVQRNEAQARLESIAEVRPVDVGVAQAELEQANAAVKQAQADLALTEVRSPIDGRVLKVDVRPGEVVDERGIISIGQTERMYVVAEVYETDIDRVRLRQKAIITGAAFSEELEGEVVQVGLEVKQQNVFESDPLVNTDNKVVEVKIRLAPESSKRVTALSNLQVQVVIVL
ncbi:response regulator [Pleurocapsales cyanobacterium LEGE 10410]|nr:response regulator [Pleurocapsales cyanobacterium LEGE 10410]